MGKVIGIATHEEKRGPMVVYAAAKVSFANGIGKDVRGAIRDDRQITLMSIEGWNAALSELDRYLHWSTRRANILIEGIDLENTKGEVLKIGEFLVEITGELGPCDRMEEEMKGLKKALTPNWRGGVTCKLLSEGELKEGDAITFMDRV